jgi:hypothetical protein
VHAWSTFNGIFSGQANVVGGEVFVGTSSANRVIGASEGVVALMLATDALSNVIEAEVVFQSKGGRAGRQARSLSNVLCLRANDGADD